MTRRAPDGPGRLDRNAQKSAFNGSLGGQLRSARPVNRGAPNSVPSSANNSFPDVGGRQIFWVAEGVTDVTVGQVLIDLAGRPWWKSEAGDWQSLFTGNHLFLYPDESNKSLSPSSNLRTNYGIELGYLNSFESLLTNFHGTENTLVGNRNTYTDLDDAVIFGIGNYIYTQDVTHAVMGAYNSLGGEFRFGSVSNMVGGSSSVVGVYNIFEGPSGYYTSVIGTNNQIYDDYQNTGLNVQAQHMAVLGTNNDVDNYKDLQYFSVVGVGNNPQGKSGSSSPGLTAEYVDVSGVINVLTDDYGSKVNSSALVGALNFVDTGVAAASEYFYSDIVAMGTNNNIDSATVSAAMGTGNTVSYSVESAALGVYGYVDSASYSVAVGSNTSVEGLIAPGTFTTNNGANETNKGYSAVFGVYSTVESSYAALALGSDVYVWDADYSMAAGYLSYVGGASSAISFGRRSEVTGDASIVLGAFGGVSGDHSWILGSDVRTPYDYNPPSGGTILANPLATNEHGILAARFVEIARSEYGKSELAPLADPQTGIVLHSPDGTAWKILIDNTGTLAVSAY